MKTIINMDASSAYFTDDTIALERGNLRNRGRSYAHKLHAPTITGTALKEQMAPSVLLSVLLRRFQGLARG